MQSIDINCDMGESYGQFVIGNDAAIFPYISSCNIACGLHGGDPLTIEATIRQALQHGVRIGAHPSYPDLAGFGRRRMHLPPAELTAVVKYQIAVLKSLTESQGGQLAYVKPHGALYNVAADDETEARAVLRAVQEMDSALALMGLAGSTMERLAAEVGCAFIAEAFADRRYTAQGRLVARSRAGAVLETPALAAAQVLRLVQQQQVESNEGPPVVVRAQSICIHGDNPAAVAMLQAIQQTLADHDIRREAVAAC